MTAIANATTAANNLVNAITLVNTEHDSLQENARVQECLEKAKVVRKQIVRYVQVKPILIYLVRCVLTQISQLVENEDMIGTLIETNDRIIAALETYDKARLTSCYASHCAKLCPLAVEPCTHREGRHGCPD